MRVIESKMLKAIEDAKVFSLGNTAVSYSGTIADVYLYGHHIASVSGATGYVEVNKDTLKEYPTRTTMSRLRALGVNVYTKGGVVMLDNKPL